MSILRADSIRDRAGTGAPDFPNGLTGNITGNVTGTATTATLANTATVATNAQGITGTPNITVGTVSGTDATFSGNLTVNGTTTTIDTAVTAVDSLAVDGSITALGNCGIGTAVGSSASTRLVVYEGSGNGQTIEVKAANTGGVGSQPGIRFTAPNNDNIGAVYGDVNSDTLQFSTGATERLRITSGGTAIFKAGLAEKNVNGTTLAAASNNIALSSGNVHRFTGDESGAKTVNFTGVDSTLAAGESVSFTVILTPNNSGYINAVTVDGATPGTATKWSGGSAPSSGSNGGRDVYTFTIFKYGAAVTDNEVYGAVTNYG